MYTAHMDACTKHTHVCSTYTCLYRIEYACIHAYTQNMHTHSTHIYACAYMYIAYIYIQTHSVHLYAHSTLIHTEHKTTHACA